MDTVYIRGLRIDAIIGIHDWERNNRQPLVLDLEVAADIPRAAASDVIADAVDYSAISQRLVDFVGASDYQLIETLAEKIAQIVIEEFAVTWLRLCVSKPQAVPEAETVGVCIERSSAP